MKKQIIIAVCLLTLTFLSCTKKSSTSSSSSSSGDSTFNGNYLQLTIGGKYFNEKDVTTQSGHIVIVAATFNPNAAIVTGTSPMLSITLTDNFGIYGLTSAFMYSLGSSTGTYQIPNGYTVGGGLSVITQYSPVVGYSDTTGTMSITHNGSDYIQGTINSTFYANGSTYPVTGAFKINW